MSACRHKMLQRLEVLVAQACTHAHTVKKDKRLRLAVRPAHKLAHHYWVEWTQMQRACLFMSLCFARCICITSHICNKHCSSIDLCHDLQRHNGMHTKRACKHDTYYNQIIERSSTTHHNQMLDHRKILQMACQSSSGAHMHAMCMQRKTAYLLESHVARLREEEIEGSCECRCGSAFVAAVASCGNGGGNEDEVGDAQAMRSLAWSAVALRFCRFCCVCARLDDMCAFVFTTREKMVPA